MPFTWSNIWPGGEPFYTPAQTTNTQIGNPTTGSHLLHPDAAKRQDEKNIAMQNLMKENSDQLGTITNTGQVNKMSMFPPWMGAATSTLFGPTAASLYGIGSMATNKFKNWMGNYNLANRNNLNLENYITLDGTTPVIDEGQLLADTTEQAPVVYPGSAYSPHRGFEEMQFDETVQAPAKKGFTWPGILGLAKKVIEPNTPEENFALDYFNRDPQTGRIAGSQVDNVFSGKNPVSAWGKGMSAAGQKRIDTIENTLRTKYNLGDEEIEDVYAGTYKGPVTSQLIHRLQTFKNQHDRYTKDLADATGGADTKGGPVSTTTTTGGTGDGPSPHGGGSIEAFRSHSPGGISQAQSRAARGGMDGWRLAQGGRVGLYAGGDPEAPAENVYEFMQDQGVPYGDMASAVDPMDALNDMSMEVFGKPLHQLTGEEYQMLIDMANDQAMAEQPEGLASLV